MMGDGKLGNLYRVLRTQIVAGDFLLTFRFPPGTHLDTPLSVSWLKLRQSGALRRTFPGTVSADASDTLVP
jgi:hypothetical protein